MFFKTTSMEKIESALNLLAEASKENQEELANSIKNHFHDLYEKSDSNGKHDYKKEAAEKVQELVGKSTEKAKEKLKALKRKHPLMPLLSLLAAGVLLAGFYLNKKK